MQQTLRISCAVYRNEREFQAELASVTSGRSDLIGPWSLKPRAFLPWMPSVWLPLSRYLTLVRIIECVKYCTASVALYNEHQAVPLGFYAEALRDPTPPEARSTWKRCGTKVPFEDKDGASECYSHSDLPQPRLRIASTT